MRIFVRSGIISFFIIIGLTLSSLGSPIVNVKTFGANGSDNLDDTKFIQEAIDYTASISGTLHFPKGRYVVSKLIIKCSLVGSENSILAKTPNSYDQVYEFCLVDNQNSIVISKINFHGAGIESKGRRTGSIPLFISNSSNIKVQDCKFEYSPQSGLRVESCRNIELVRCVARSSLGNFGDGFYFENSSEISVTDCLADNYMRIGYVVERNSRNIIFRNCIARNGHSASSLNGGAEYNAGFWYEGSGDIETVNCQAIDNTHFGFVSTSGVDKQIRSHEVTFTYENCLSVNSAIGFRVSSSGNPVVMTLTDCRAMNVNQGFIALARDATDKFEFKACTVDLITSNSTGLNDMGFMWESSINEKSIGQSLPEFRFIRSKVNYKLPIATSKLFTRDINNGDIGTYGGGSANIYIEDFTNSLKQTGVIIKAIRGQPNFFIKNTNANLNYLVKKESVKIYD